MAEPDESKDGIDESWSLWRDAPLPERPPAEVIARTAARLRSLSAGETEASTQHGRTLMYRITRYGGAAAAAFFLIGLVLWLVLMDRSADFAFAAVQNQVQQAQTVQYVETRTVDGKLEGTQRHFIRGRYLERIENLTPDGKVTHIHISDAQNGKYVSIDPAAKKFVDLATQITLKADGGGREEVAVQPMPEVDFYRRIREVPADPIKRLPEKRIMDRPVIGFYYEQKTDGGTWKRTYWIDPENKLPVRVEISYSGNAGRPVAEGAKKQSTLQFVLTGFVFDAELDEKLFSTEVPAGYDVEKGGFVDIK